MNNKFMNLTSGSRARDVGRAKVGVIFFALLLLVGSFQFKPHFY